MSDISDWTVVLSGPLARRAPLLATLEQAGADISDQPPASHSHGLPSDDPAEAWITCRGGDVDEVAARAGEAGWVLRMHWPTPPCRACGGFAQGAVCLHCGGTGRTNKPVPSTEEQTAKTIAELTARLAVLEARG